MNITRVKAAIVVKLTQEEKKTSERGIGAQILEGIWPTCLIAINLQISITAGYYRHLSSPLDARNLLNVVPLGLTQYLQVSLTVTPPHHHQH